MTGGFSSDIASRADDGSHRPAGSQAQVRKVAQPGGRFLLRIDGVFEAMLGVVLILSPATGLAGALHLPAPAGDPVLVVLGALLLPALPILWKLSRAPRRAVLLAIAAANGAGILATLATLQLRSALADLPA